MMPKQCVRFFLLALTCCLLARAQDSSQTNITGGGSSGKLTVFTGAHAIGNSIASQSGGRVHIAGGLSVANHASVSNNTIYGSNGQTFGLVKGAGIFGQLSTSGESSTGANWPFQGAGAWGDGGADSNYGVIGTALEHSAGIFHNNSSVDNYYPLYGYNAATGGTGYIFGAFNGDGVGCSIDPSGNFSCSGSKNAVVPVDGGKHQVALAAIESPRNWFEDFGSAQLVGGVTTVQLDSKYIQTVNTKMEYHVFLTPNGDCKGLYVNQKTANSFEVREVGNGNSSVKFDYRISALRKNYEKVRFADHSREFPGRGNGKVRQATK